MRSRWLSASMGVWFASLQAGYYLLVETYFSATYQTYWLLLVAWLLGVLGGLGTTLRWGRSLEGLALAAFYLVAWRLRDHASPCGLPIIALCIALGGVASGQFFRARQRLFPRAGQLFLWENTGFLLGWVGVMVGWLCAGEATLLWVPMASWASTFLGTP